jgi:hypothetical protein
MDQGPRVFGQAIIGRDVCERVFKVRRWGTGDFQTGATGERLIGTQDKMLMLWACRIIIGTTAQWMVWLVLWHISRASTTLST